MGLGNDFLTLVYFYKVFGYGRSDGLCCILFYKPIEVLGVPYGPGFPLQSFCPIGGKKDFRCNP